MWKKVILGSLIAIIGSYVLFQIAYVATSGPSFCAKCHEVKEYVTSWQQSPHNNLNCLECHQPRGELGKFHAKARGLNYVFQHYSGDFTVPTRAVVSDQNCLICHLGDSETYPDTLRLKNTAKVNHYETIKKSQSCLECHRDTAHAVDIYLTPDLKGAKPQRN
ncbi:cytochrome c3 family protein [Desulfosporosinus nitroreducens]|uniref:Cytochrome c-type protein n=1 Tax=Desulfosporosinus nitroreducens TaxID=2018668 RepID=A0ABT8QUP7_9FIRM|nr:NapC/NirT family cytochrome c [Desulfosporosinus nitroreducens]MDO0824179.1 NapC/NirT family cytochrome c [Desulfosporosinus nitroreducens]